MTRFLLYVLGAFALGACSAPTSSSIGSQERAQHFLQCLPVALPRLTADAAKLQAAKNITTADVLAGLNQRVQSGDAVTVSTACGPYLADLVVDGNAQAIAFRAALLRQPLVTPPSPAIGQTLPTK